MVAAAYEGKNDARRDARDNALACMADAPDASFVDSGNTAPASCETFRTPNYDEKDLFCEAWKKCVLEMRFCPSLIGVFK
eukprot:CAMPEP_0168861316 /NCGR_PEP_ID=MMETSP0727-20121128/17851_1 /TAXON_ID=265536 /ORGANISM="Amphiprora sp., Strain CCMP467" /LENGTH=79 /DNA_ID=CAMNT_0008916309 /DNA_START=242 /DNA_END=478 /DNA_ORIENTATION=+